MEQRNQRMLEDILKLPGNNTCADCHASAPRWASVNLGIFLCVGCASVHRKMGTHKSRVKSVTLDTWSRDQIVAVRSIGNTASNAIYNPNERLHPPPPSYGHEDRDSEIERYIRKKYEQGAFKGGAAARLDGKVEPTSLNRARERDGRLPAGAAVLGRENRANPELNDIVVKKDFRERELPPLPVEKSPVFGKAPPRARPVRSPSNNNVNAVGPVWSTSAQSSSSASTAAAQPQASGQARSAPVANLIDMSGGSSSTLPLQVNMSGAANPGWAGQQQPQSQFLSAQPTSWSSTTLSTSPSANITMSGFSPSPQAMAGSFGTSPSAMYAQQLSPQPGYGQQLGVSPQPAFGQHLSPQPSYQAVSVSPSTSPAFQGQAQFLHSPQQGFQLQQPQQQQQFQQQQFQPQQQQQQQMQQGGFQQQGHQYGGGMQQQGYGGMMGGGMMQSQSAQGYGYGAYGA
ncbi:hypothetical protein IAT38_008143 [Cryptococcus sp. DSM 104549]